MADEIMNSAEPLDIGLLNMMPDAALKATERQFVHLLAGADQAVKLHLFTLPEIERGAGGRAHVAHYNSFAQIQARGLDALIISGAHVDGNALADQPFWRALGLVISWAESNVAAMLCSCLATHAVLQFLFGQNRVALPTKRWGVYLHHVVAEGHPLVAGLAPGFDVPHSRCNEVTAAQFTSAGMKVLVVSEAGEVHLAVRDGRPQWLFWQGHPEYETVSLLKEYKREVARFAKGEVDEYPPFPANYLGSDGRTLLSLYEGQVKRARSQNMTVPDFPEAQLAPELKNTWREASECVFNNWLGSLRACQ